MEIISASLLGLGTGKYVYLLGFMLLFLVLGCFIEPIAIMVMTLPIMFPVMVKAGFDPIWLGVGVGQAGRDQRAHAAGRAQRIRGQERVAGAGDARPGVRRRDAVHSASTCFRSSSYVLFPGMLLWLPNLMKS